MSCTRVRFVLALVARTVRSSIRAVRVYLTWTDMSGCVSDYQAQRKRASRAAVYMLVITASQTHDNVWGAMPLVRAVTISGFPDGFRLVPDCLPVSLARARRAPTLCCRPASPVPDASWMVPDWFPIGSWSLRQGPGPIVTPTGNRPGGAGPIPGWFPHIFRLVPDWLPVAPARQGPGGPTLCAAGPQVPV